ncbi:Flavonoid 3'-monooxygenase protein [Dioscorea alata]|uniref:Flavonoid 3'-monooxygenase protein n=1 Tax=Dioscorea alata TaxID=55571 RepID=A0ACB7U8C9_DIOAL|nr:Flavonoid 3'-monooxygenase protein [Dioscorea alata]
MEPSTLIITYTFIILTTLTLIIIKLSGKPRRKLNLPPGPKPWPIIGNLNLIGALPHRSIHQLSQTYGPIMQLKLGSFPVVVVSSVEMAKAVLNTQDVTFASRPKTAAGKHITYNYSGILWSPYGPYWRQAHKMCIMELFTPKRLESYEYIRNQELKYLIHDLYEMKPTTVITLKDYLSIMNVNIISRMVLGRKFTDEGSENSIVSPEEFKKMLDELFLLSGVLNIGDSIPWLDFLDLQGYIKRMKKLRKKFDWFLEHVLDEHNERMTSEGESFVAKDMVDVLLQLAADPNLEIKLGRDSVKAFTLDFFVGGIDSSTLTLEWAMSELLKQPQILAKAIEELDRVTGKNQWVYEKDIPNLPYIEAIVKETMRMHPVAPTFVPRFRPERFIGKAIDVISNHFELLPFGAGRRMCPGYSIGLKVVQVSLANLLHGFKWMLPHGMKAENLNMDEIFRLSTPRKVPLEVVLEPRLPSHIYFL